MNNSPDSFHHIRISNSSIKSSNINLQLMEFKSHTNSIGEYKLDMLEHLLSLESETLPNLSLIQQQPEINLRMRPLLLDFLMDVINKLNLSKSTFPLTVNLIDRYCSIRIVKKQHYQLLGLTCLWISCKNLDSKFKIPSLNDLCKMCCNCYDKKLFLEMENHVLKSLSWLIGAPTFDSFIDFYLNLSHSSFLAGLKNNNKLCNEIKILSIYICELIQFYPNIYFNYNSSQIALTSFITSVLILDIKLFNLSQHLTLLYQVTQQEILTLGLFNNCFQLLVKVLKCPPPSLKLRYFNEDGRYIHLMKLLINFSNNNLNKAPVVMKKCSMSSGNGSTTPKFYPTTPTSSNISPKSVISSGGIDEKALSVDLTKYNQGVRNSTVLPSPKLSPPESSSNRAYFSHDQPMTEGLSTSSSTTSTASTSSHRKRSYEDLDISRPQNQSIELKRSKSMSTRPVFYIS